MSTRGNLCLLSFNKLVHVDTVPTQSMVLVLSTLTRLRVTIAGELVTRFDQWQIHKLSRSALIALTMLP